MSEFSYKIPGSSENTRTFCTFETNQKTYTNLLLIANHHKCDLSILINQILDRYIQSHMSFNDKQRNELIQK